MSDTPSDETNDGSKPEAANVPLIAAEVCQLYGARAYAANGSHQEGELSLPEVLAKLGFDQESDNLNRLLTEQAALDGLAKFPVIGILGMLNSGKSSLVRSFLGDAGQSRIPIGIAPEDGTQRFVFWLPEAWRKGHGLSQMKEFIKDNFGTLPELLSEQAKEAKQQYGDVSRFKIPLIAFDSGLDQRQVAFLDCPDIQREMAGESLDEEPQALMVSKSRKDALARTAELCSAFVLVSELRKLETKLFHDFLRSVRQVIPGLPIFTALNQAPGERSGAAWCEAFSGLFAELELDRVYLAFDFNDGRSRGELPEDVKAEWDSLKDKDRNPLVFFTEEPTSSAPRLLTNMPTAQSPGRWMGKRIILGWQEFAARCEKTEASIEQKGSEIEERRKAATEAIKQAVEEVLIEEDQIKMPLALASHLLEKAIRDTAPRLLRPLIDMRSEAEKRLKGVRFLCSYLKGKLSGTTPEQMESAIKKKFEQENGVSINDLHEALQNHAHTHTLELDAETLKAGSQHAFERWISRFDTFAHSVDRDELKTYVKKSWDDMPRVQKWWFGTKVAGVAALSVLAVWLAPFDGGTTVVLATSLGSVLGGITAVFATKDFDKYLRSTLGQRTFSELTAYLLDAFGLPRSDLEGERVSKEKIEINLGETEEVEPAVADLHLGQSFQRLEGAVGLSAWIRGRIRAEGEKSHD